MKKIRAYLLGGKVLSNDSNAFSLFEKSSLGSLEKNIISYLDEEVIYLLEKEKIEVYSRNKKLSLEEVKKKILGKDKKSLARYIVFKDLREKGYVVKSGFKFGGDFRVYDKGCSPKKEHSKWIVFVDLEKNNFRWTEFSAKNRVAHSTRKNLLIAIVDNEGDVIYYEIRWVRL